jgi:hypothetical protein
MKTEEFNNWLRSDCLSESGKPRSRNAQAAIASRCNNVERWEGDLDIQFQQDGLVGLLKTLTFSASDSHSGKKVRLKIPIVGNALNGTRSYKDAIKRYCDFLIETQHQDTNSVADVELSAFEGGVRLAFIKHPKREHLLQSAKVVEAKKLTNGRLKCEVSSCGFDFEAVYGELGRDYAQVHHLKPLGDRTTPSETKLTDLAVVCANCRAMIHRGGKCRALADLIPPRLRVSALK